MEFTSRDIVVSGIAHSWICRRSFKDVNSTFKVEINFPKDSAAMISAEYLESREHTLNVLTFAQHIRISVPHRIQAF